MSTDELSGGRPPYHQLARTSYKETGESNEERSRELQGSSVEESAER